MTLPFTNAHPAELREFLDLVPFHQEELCVDAGNESFQMVRIPEVQPSFFQLARKWQPRIALVGGSLIKASTIVDSNPDQWRSELWLLYPATLPRLQALLDVVGFGRDDYRDPRTWELPDPDANSPERIMERRTLAKELLARIHQELEVYIRLMCPLDVDVKCLATPPPEIAKSVAEMVWDFNSRYYAPRMSGDLSEYTESECHRLALLGSFSLGNPGG